VRTQTRRLTRKTRGGKRRQRVLSVRESSIDLRLPFWWIVTQILRLGNIKRKVYNSRLLKRHTQRRYKMKKMKRNKRGSVLIMVGRGRGSLGMRSLSSMCGIKRPKDSREETCVSPLTSIRLTRRNLKTSLK
jgi:hypothetical protein